MLEAIMYLDTTDPLVITHRGVAIVLSPQYYAGWKAAGAAALITMLPDDEFVGCFIGLTVKLECRNKPGWKVKGRKKQETSIVLSLVSTYHPCHTESEHS
jgi:hypothetical protein